MEVIRREILKVLLRTLLKVHSYSYNAASRMAYRVHGKNPKHWIINYKEWFVDKLNKEDRVVDIGSNVGDLPIEIASKAAHVHAIEIDDDLAEKGRKNTQSIKNITYHHADATRFDYKSIGDVDVVTLSNVLEHIKDRKGLLKKITSSVSWSAVGPRFLIRVPSIEREWLAVYKKQIGLEYRLDYTHYTEYDEEELRNELSDCGLVIKAFNVRFGEYYAVCEGELEV